LPDPACEIFAGGIFQAFDVVQIIVIELVVKWFEHGLDVGEIHDPATVFADRTVDINTYVECMTMQAAAFVPGRYVGQAMGGFKAEFLVYLHGTGHGTGHGNGNPVRLLVTNEGAIVAAAGRVPNCCSRCALKQRQPHYEARALARLGIHFDGAAVVFGDDEIGN